MPCQIILLPNKLLIKVTTYVKQIAVSANFLCSQNHVLYAMCLCVQTQTLSACFLMTIHSHLWLCLH